MSDPFVLIHGAWQGSWTFDRLLPELSELGLTGVAVDLPGNGADDTDPADISLALYLDVLENVVDGLGGRAHIVGHSGGGVIATAFAERSPERTASVIYLAGMCLPQGMAFGELQERVAGPGEVFGISGDIQVSEDGLTSTVPIDRAIECFLNDCDYETAAQAAARLTPQPERGRFITSPTTPERFGTVAKLYIEATNDRSMILDAQRAMQRFIPDMPVVSLPTGHVPQFTDPAGLARLLASFANGLSETSQRSFG